MRILNMESFIRGNIGNIFSKIKWTDREYHVQDNADVAHKYVKIYCDTNQFPALPFCGPHQKPQGARGLSKHYHLRFDSKPYAGRGFSKRCCSLFDTKLGNGVCAI